MHFCAADKAQYIPKNKAMPKAQSELQVQLKKQVKQAPQQQPVAAAHSTAIASAWKSVGIVRYNSHQTRLLVRKRRPLLTAPRRPSFVVQEKWTRVPLRCNASGSSSSSSGYNSKAANSQEEAMMTATVKSVVTSSTSSTSSSKLDDSSSTTTHTEEQRICITIFSSSSSSNKLHSTTTTSAGCFSNSSLSCQASCLTVTANQAAIVSDDAMAETDRHSASTVTAVTLAPSAASMYDAEFANDLESPRQLHFTADSRARGGGGGFTGRMRRGLRRLAIGLMTSCVSPA